MAEKFSRGVRVVTELATENKENLLELIGDRKTYESRVRWLERAARAAGISYRAAKAVFYAERGERRESVGVRIRNALAERKRAREAKTRNELDIFRDRLSALEALLLTTDQAMHQPSIDALRNATREVRKSVGPDGDSDSADTS